MNWQQKILKKHLKGTLFASIFTIIFILSVIIGNQFFGWHFEWKEIDPIELPPIWIRVLLSVFTFLTLGNWLFQAYFYKMLYEVTKFIGFSYKDYTDIKKWIWYFLMLITALVFIPWIIDILNSIVSFFFNIIQFIISTWSFSWISLGITIIVALGYFYITKKEPFVISSK